MKGKIVFLILTAVLSLSACKTMRERKTAKQNEEAPAAIIVDSFDAYKDGAAITISNVVLVKNIMTISVAYSGGCTDHEFKLIGAAAIQKSLPAKRGIKLWHNAKDDTCREMIETDLKFDISAFAYENSEIILNLDGWETPISYTKSK